MSDDAALTAESGHDVAASAGPISKAPQDPNPRDPPLGAHSVFSTKGGTTMMAALPALCVLTGGAIVAYALQTAIRTFLLPQPGLSLLSRMVFRAVRPVF